MMRHHNHQERHHESQTRRDRPALRPRDDDPRSRNKRILKAAAGGASLRSSGVAADRIITKGFGESRPIADNAR